MPVVLEKCTDGDSEIHDINGQVMPHAVWYTYTNVYQQLSSRHATRKEKELGMDVARRCWVNDQKYAQHSGLERDSFDQAIVLTTFPGTVRPPANPANFDPDETAMYGVRETFVHVYGRREHIEIRFRDNDRAVLKTDIEKIMEMLRVRHNLTWIVDAKPVVKRPLRHACQGDRLFLKLYANRDTRWHTLRDVLNKDRDLQELLDGGELHGVGLGVHNEWMMNRRVKTSGRLRFLRNDIIPIRGPHFDTIHVHHNDIEFDTRERFPCPVDDPEAYIREHVYEPLLKFLCDDYVACQLVQKRFERAVWTLVREKGKGEWTWLWLKRLILHNAFGIIKTLPTIIQFTTFLQNNLAPHATHFEGRSLAAISAATFRAFLGAAYHCRALLKVFWEKRVLVDTEDSTNRQQHIAALAHVTNKSKRRVMFDIETDHELHVKKEEQITCIPVSLYDHEHEYPFEHRVFIWLPTPRPIDVHAVVAMIRQLFAGKCEMNLVANKTYFVHRYSSEQEMLSAALNYIANARPSLVGYFNGHKFDLPFIMNRNAILSAATPERAAQLRDPKTQAEAKYRVPFSFTHRADEATIRYRPKATKHNYKTWGVQHHVNKVKVEQEQYKKERRRCEIEEARERFYANDEEEDSEIDEDPLHEGRITDDDGVEPVLANVCNEYQTFLKPARKIQSVGMRTVSLVDIMLHVGDRNRGCKLDTAASKLLGLNKVNDPAVGYDQLENTRQNGDLVKYCAYASVDTMLLVALERTQQIDDFITAVADALGLPVREVYLQESVRYLISIIHKSGYGENMLTGDTSVLRDERPLWIPGFSFDAAKHYYLQRPPGGITVPDVYGIIPSCVGCVDFSAFYPSIMHGCNPCMSSQLEPSFIQKKGWTTEEHYNTYPLMNVRPVVTHVCERLCDAIKTGKGDPSKCKFKLHYEKTHYDAHYIKPELYESILRKASIQFTAQRGEKKKAMAAAKAAGNHELAQVYNVQQLALKVLNNSLYGASMRLDSITGDTITNLGRKFNTLVADYAQKQWSMDVANGDTDSNMLRLITDEKAVLNYANMCTYYKMDPEQTDVVHIVQKWFSDFEQFANECNNLGIYPKECKLEAEKIFPMMINYKKKSYAGDKLLPGKLEVAPHMSGQTGKKADTTPIKTLLQCGANKMFKRQDFLGYFEFARDVIDLIGTELRAVQRYQARITNLCAQLPDDSDSNVTNEEVHRQLKEIVQSRDTLIREYGGGLLPLDWLTSEEKVGDVDADTQTLPTKRALEICKIRGEPRHNADRFVKMQRPFSVQVTSSVEQAIRVFMLGKETDDMKKRRERRERASMMPTEYNAMLKKREDAEAKEERERNTLTKVDITAMKECYRLTQDGIYAPQERDRILAQHLLNYLQMRGAMYKRELDSGMTILLAPDPITVTDSKRVARAKRRLQLYMSTYTPIDEFPPLYMFTPDFAICTFNRMVPIKSDKVVYELPRPTASCDLWTLYVNELVDLQLRYVDVEWTGERVRLTMSQQGHDCLSYIQFHPDDSSWAAEHVRILNAAAGSIYRIDMHEYREQTTSTPYIVTSYNGTKVFLLNRDSYREPERDAFAFASKALELYMHLQRAFGNVFNNKSPDIVQLENMVGMSMVRISCISTSTGTTCATDVPITRIVRSDERVGVHEKWLWHEDPIYMRLVDFMSVLQSATYVAEEGNEELEFRVHRDTNEVSICDKLNTVKRKISFVSDRAHCHTLFRVGTKRAHFESMPRYEVHQLKLGEYTGNKKRRQEPPTPSQKSNGKRIRKFKTACKDARVQAEPSTTQNTLITDYFSPHVNKHNKQL